MVERSSKPSSNLKRVLREVRIAQAEQNDGLVELRDAEQARLELLAEALEGTVADLPEDYSQLMVGLLPGRPPRYWVDATSFVHMARDRRQYQFVKDSRIGRTVLAESASVQAMAEAVTRYLAERIVEREQALESDWVSKAVRQRRASVTAQRPGSDNQVAIWGLLGFGLGMIAGMFLLVAYAWFTVG